jgi:hypothetical protein
MDHTITIGGLLSTFGIVGGLVLAALGVLIVFAQGMRTNPEEGSVKPGCICFVVGLVLVVASIARLF